MSKRPKLRRETGQHFSRGSWFLSLCKAALTQYSLYDSPNLVEEARQGIGKLIEQLAIHGHTLLLDLITAFDEGKNTAEMGKVCQAILERSKAMSETTVVADDLSKPATKLPKTITFPYSRHSSYPELCDLLQIFKPKDVWPCTVDEDRWLKEGACRGAP